LQQRRGNQENDMPEYIYPGVFVEETATGTRPIEGVGTSTAGFMGPLTVALVRAVRAHVPEWTTTNDADPGVTLVELAAFLAENALLTPSANWLGARSAAARAADGLHTLAGRGATNRPLSRPNFYQGRLLDAAAFEAEQDYHREKLRRHNRALHGVGIVHGLDVRVERVDGEPNIVITPGYAIGPEGEDLALPCGLRVPTPSTAAPVFVTLRYCERAHAPAAVDAAPAAMTMTEEGASVGLHAVVAPPAMALARLVHDDGDWKRNVEFVPPRAK
jgi:hypothetical protein